MILTLEVNPPQAATLGNASRRVFSAQGGTIGRASSCDWVLSHRKVSGRHATISFQDSVFYIVDDQSANGVFINSTKPPGARDAGTRSRTATASSSTRTRWRCRSRATAPRRRAVRTRSRRTWTRGPDAPTIRSSRRIRSHRRRSVRRTPLGPQLQRPGRTRPARWFLSRSSIR